MLIYHYYKIYYILDYIPNILKKKYIKKYNIEIIYITLLSPPSTPLRSPGSSGAHPPTPHSPIIVMININFLNYWNCSVLNLKNKF